MVFGIGEGKIDIVLPKTSYVCGEAIKGKLILTLNQPKKARGLRVELRAEREVYKNIIKKGRVNRVKSIETVYKYVLPIKGEGEFTSGEYDFEIVIPPEASQWISPQSPAINLGPISINIFSPPPLRWYINASLDLPLAFDINKIVMITVSLPKQQ